MMNNVVIFGAGVVFEAKKNELFKNYNVLAVVDNFKKNHIIGGVVIQDPKILKEIEYDYILVTVLNRYIILKQLSNLTIDYKKIKFITPDIEACGKAELSVNSDYSLSVKIEDININLKTLTEHNVFKTIFIDKDYEIGLSNIKPTIVIDIGMNVGMASLYFANKYFVEKVYSFEPFPETYQRGLDNFNNNSNISSKIKPFNVGLDNYSDTKCLKYDANISGSMRTYNESVNNVDGVIVKIEKAADYIKPIINKHKDYQVIMKVDCEGAEYGIFENLNFNNLFQEIDIILMEFHIENNRTVYELEEILKDNSYTYFTRKPFTNKNVGYIYAVKSK